MTPAQVYYASGAFVNRERSKPKPSDPAELLELGGLSFH